MAGLDRADDAVALHDGDRGADRRNDAGPPEHRHDRGCDDAGFGRTADDGMHRRDRPMGDARGTPGVGKRSEKSACFLSGFVSDCEEWPNTGRTPNPGF